MIPKELKAILSKDDEVVHGAVCFEDTRVPVSTQLDYQEAGLSIDRYLADYPNVPRRSAEALLRYLASHSRCLFELGRVA